MVTYKVTVLSEEHDINTTIDCNDDVFILDAAEEQGVELPYLMSVHVQRVLVK
jgi:ferredoxin